MNTFMIRPIDVYEVVLRQKKTLITLFSATFVFVTLLSFVLPKVFRSQTVIHVGVNYFQNPLIQDMVATTYDPIELKAQREGLLRKSLNFDFATKTGERIGFFKTPADSKLRPLEVEYLLRSLEVTPITTTQFKLVFKARTPEIAYQVVKSATDAIAETMYNDRLQTIRELRDAINAQLGQDDGESSSSKSERPKPAVTTLSKQLETYQQELRRLTRTYSEHHPKVIMLSKKVDDLKAFINGEPGSAGQMKTHFDPVAGDTADDLQKKSHLLGIALEIESKDPTMRSYLSVIEQPVMPVSQEFPKPRMFMLFGLVAGAMLATFGAAALELYRRIDLRPKHVAEALGVPLVEPVTVHAPEV